MTAAVKAGANSAPFSRRTYNQLLNLCATCTRIVYLTTWRESARATYRRLRETIEILEMDASDGRVRKQPFCLLLQGSEGTGKTAAAIKVAQDLIKLKYGRVLPEDIVVLNETDEFQSEYRSYHKAVIFDDLAAETTNMNPPNPYRKILDFVNNVRKTSLNPNVELKGNVYIDSEIVIFTTNTVIESHCSTFMVSPAALFRRFNRIYNVFRSEECWEFLNYNTGLSAGGGWSYCNNKPSHHECLLKGKRVDYEAFIEDLRSEFSSHSAKQESFVDMMNSAFDTQPVSSGLPNIIPKVINWFKPNPSLVAQSGDGDSLSYSISEVDDDITGFSDISAEDSIVKPATRVPYSGISATERTRILNQAIEHGGIFYDFGDVLIEERGRLAISSSKTMYETQCLITFMASLEKRNHNSPIFLPELRSSEELKNSLGLMDPLIFDPSISPLAGFREHNSRNDPEMMELLTTVPNNLKLVLREWVHKSGVGDFVFYFRYEGAYHFLVAEVKRSGRNIKQLELSAKSFNSKYRSLYDHGHTTIWKASLSGSEPFNLEFHSGPNNTTIKAFLRGVINKWYKSYQALRCAETV